MWFLVSTFGSFFVEFNSNWKHFKSYKTTVEILKKHFWSIYLAIRVINYINGKYIWKQGYIIQNSLTFNAVSTTYYYETVIKPMES